MEADQRNRLHENVATIARTDFATVRCDSTVREALDEIRAHGVGERIVYFYVVDREGRLVGVLPTRRLLTADLDRKIDEVMITQVTTIHEGASILEAHEFLVQHRFLALPVVDAEDRIVGVIDVGMFTEGDFEDYERERVEEVFESIGFRISEVRDASPFRAFRFRFPWLLATIASGSACAVLTSVYDVTLAKSLVLAFFLTLVLGLGESVSIQSMTLTIQALRTIQPTLAWYVRSVRREVGTAALLGAACGSIVGLIVWIWRGAQMAAVTIGGSILLVICVSCFIGLTIPTVVHALRLDPKIAAGPLTLAMADLSTILIYFSLATMLL